MIVLVFHARAVDWQALQHAWLDCCAAHRPRLAGRMILCRNGHDAAQVLVLIDFPDGDARDADEAWRTSLASCFEQNSIQNSIEEGVWEIIERNG